MIDSISNFKEWFFDLSLDKQKEFISSLSDQELDAIKDQTDFWLRDKQIINGQYWRYYLAKSGRGFGKMLDLETELPTSNGFIKLKDLKEGDQLFDEQGNICFVTQLHPIDNEPKTYKITFNDHTTILACADHLWETYTKSERKHNTKPKIRTTQQIFETQLTKCKKQETNHSIKNTLPVNYPEQKLIIPPYILGCWLGDGTSKSGSIECADEEILTNIKNYGYSIHKTNHSISHTSKSSNYRIGDLVISLNPPKPPGKTGELTLQLKELNLLNNKHVPDIYLRGSFNQRLELLQGLMDTDGSIDIQGHIEFCNANKQIAESVWQIANSLGIKATINKNKSYLHGKECQDRYRVHFITKLPVFKLQRKLQRLKKTYAQDTRNTHRYIVSVEPHKPVSMRCISVDSPSNLYLITKAYIPTHNTRMGAAWLKKQIDNHRPIANRHDLYVMVGPTYDDVIKTMVPEFINLFPNYKIPELLETKKTIICHNGAIIKFYTAEKYTRGPNIEKLWCDELVAWQNPDETFKVLELAVRIGNPQILITTTPPSIGNIEIITDLVEKSISQPDLYKLVGGSMYENPHLTDSFKTTMESRYGTGRFGQAEIYGELLTDADFALFKEKDILHHPPAPPTPDHRNLPYQIQLIKIVVAVDPAGTANPDSDETGIIVVGLGNNGHAYVLEDQSGQYLPAQWARKAIDLYHKYKANAIIAETNFGALMVTNTIRMLDSNVFIKDVKASHGKLVRAQPIAVKYEQHLVHHVGVFPQLEKQMKFFTGAASTSKKKDDRLDALVWGLTELFPPLPSIPRSTINLPNMS